MKLRTSDLRELQASLSVSLVLIVTGLSTAYFSTQAVLSARHDESSAQQQRNEAHARLRKVSSEESDTRDRFARFHRLGQRGIAGEEQRIEWISLLQSIREHRKLPDLHYQFEPQRKLDAGPTAAPALFASTSRVQLALLHEEDLTRFLGDLNEHAKALIRVRRCLIERARNDAPADPPQAGLLADCSIDWITLRYEAGK